MFVFRVGCVLCGFVCVVWLCCVVVCLLCVVVLAVLFVLCCSGVAGGVVWFVFLVLRLL